MQELLGRLVKKGALGIAGVVVSYGLWWVAWTPSSDKHQLLETMPPRLWEGGKDLDITLETSEAGAIHAVFSQDDRGVSAEQQLAAGRHHFSISIPPKTHVELSAALARGAAGARISWTVKYGGAPVHDESRTAEEAQSDDTFGLWAEFETR